MTEPIQQAAQRIYIKYQGLGVYHTPEEFQGLLLGSTALPPDQTPELEALNADLESLRDALQLQYPSTLEPAEAVPEAPALEEPTGPPEEDVLLGILQSVVETQVTSPLQDFNFLPVPGEFGFNHACSEGMSDEANQLVSYYVRCILLPMMQMMGITKVAWNPTQIHPETGAEFEVDLNDPAATDLWFKTFLHYQTMLPVPRR
jgi:hypothetical protein